MTLYLITGMGAGILAFITFAACRVGGDADARAEQFERKLPRDGADQARVGANNLCHHKDASA